MLRRLPAYPRVKSLSIGFLLACGLLTVSAMLDVSLTWAAGIVDTDPITNAVGVDLGAGIDVTYDSPISPTTVTTHTFVVQGMLSGARDGVFSFGNGNSRVALDPDKDYFPGEVVRVSTTGGISGTGGIPATPYQWQFTAGPVFARHFDGFVDADVGLLEVACGSVAWGDYDNDGDLDVLLTGAQYDDGHIAFTRIYRNDNGRFVDIGAALPDVWNSSVAWGDYDNDGDLDILLTGWTGSTRISRVYRNDGGTFSDIEAGIPAVVLGSVAWGDYDNDGDLDILLTGGDSDSNPVSRVYRNDRGSFSDIEAGLAGVFSGSVAWGDYDNDGDLDILLTGSDGYPGLFAGIYRNDGGAFVDIGAGLPALYLSSVAWGDYDNDGDLDILLTGDQPDSGYVALTRIYRNDFGSFVDIGAKLAAVFCSSVAWGDYDGDDDLDILLSGYTGSRIVTRVYANVDYISYLPVMCKSSVALSDRVVITGPECGQQGDAR